MSLENVSIHNMTPADIYSEKSLVILGVPIQDRPLVVILKPLFYSLYLFFVVTGLCGNASVCYLLACEKPLRTATNYLLVNVAMSNLLMCGIAPFTPLALLSHMSIITTPLCHILPFISSVSTNFSALILTSCLVQYSFRVYRRASGHHNRRGIHLWLSLSMWVFSIVLSVPQSVFRHFYQFELGGAAKTLCDPKLSLYLQQVLLLITITSQIIVPFLLNTVCFIWAHQSLTRSAQRRQGKHGLRTKRYKAAYRTLYALVFMAGVHIGSLIPAYVLEMFYVFCYSSSLERHKDVYSLVIHLITLCPVCSTPLFFGLINNRVLRENNCRQRGYVPP
ncbi:neuropeptide Y receptor type 2-like [Limulus polyphemus]|uniref:Neuropeptide Y receptor type 2-like n=1 Tax=Limulus polyphemus TaxID=6850 RepID=A0ABM1SRD4_LIMPO|nr:neuropeptide Y receptor type 2-like [Limulus polyphemus]XP_022246190.1 neuropeptide Y receptor type 2-like [Limulus polyphemus]